MKNKSDIDFDINDDPVGKHILKSYNHFKSECNRHKKEYRFSQVSSITLTSLSSVVSAFILLNPDLEKNFVFLNVIISSVTSTIISWSMMKKSLELWMHELYIRNKLADLARTVEFKISARDWYKKDSELALKELNEILGTSSNSWINLQKTKQSS